MPGKTAETPVPVVAPPVREREVMAAVLGAKCLPCHGRRRQEAGLDLRTREGLLKGGKSGPAIVPGKPEESLLVKRIRAQEMPPPHLQEQFSVRGLTSDEFDKVQAWIAAGALPDPEKPPEAGPGQGFNGRLQGPSILVLSTAPPAGRTRSDGEGSHPEPGGRLSVGSIGDRGAWAFPRRLTASP